MLCFQSTDCTPCTMSIAKWQRWSTSTSPGRFCQNLRWQKDYATSGGWSEMSKTQQQDEASGAFMLITWESFGFRRLHRQGCQFSASPKERRTTWKICTGGWSRQCLKTQSSWGSCITWRRTFSSHQISCSSIWTTTTNCHPRQSRSNKNATSKLYYIWLLSSSNVGSCSLCLLHWNNLYSTSVNQ